MGGSYRAPRQEDDPMLAVTAASEKATLAQKKAVAKAEAAAQGACAVLESLVEFDLGDGVALGVGQVVELGLERLWRRLGHLREGGDGGRKEDEQTGADEGQVDGAREGAAGGNHACTLQELECQDAGELTVGEDARGSGHGHGTLARLGAVSDMMAVALCIADVHADAVLDLLPAHAADIDDTRTGDADEGYQTRKNALDARADAQLGHASAHAHRDAHGARRGRGIRQPDLLHVHGHALVGVRVVDRHVETLVDPLPEDDARQTRVGHQHAAHHEQIGRHKCGHPERQQNHLARIRVYGRVDELLGLPVPFRLGARHHERACGAVGGELGLVARHGLLGGLELGIRRQQRKRRGDRGKMQQSTLERREVVAVLGNVHQVGLRRILGGGRGFRRRVDRIPLPSHRQQRRTLHGPAGRDGRGSHLETSLPDRGGTQRSTHDPPRNAKMTRRLQP
ncbi:hypothetical protein L1887_50646 [Cichorium endivia]|nr:hypothetical protein L1887_50646 [Cichorium endivia]